MGCRCEPWKSDRSKSSWSRICDFLRDGKRTIRYARAEVEHEHFGPRWKMFAGGVGPTLPQGKIDFETRQDAMRSADEWLRKVCEAEGGGFSGCGCGRRR